MKHYLGIDPGKQGAFIVLNEDSEIVELIPMPLLGKEYDKQEIRNIIRSRQFQKVALENPSVIFGAAKSAVASLMHCVGLIEGILIGTEAPYILVQPKEWQKECWKHVKVQKKSDGKTNDTKATSILAATNLWQSTNFKITNKGGKSINYNDGMIDAALLAEYARRLF